MHGVVAVDPREDVIGVDVDAGAQDRVDQDLHGSADRSLAGM